MGNEEKRCIIITAFGEIDKAAEKLNITGNDFIIAADYGYFKALEIKLTPSLVIGDMDSVSKKDIDIKTEIQKHSPIKDDTDTLLAIKEGISRGFKDFHILGGLGGRLDHTLANIQCLKFLKRQGCEGTIYDNNTLCKLIENEEITVYPDYKYFSVFCLSDMALGVCLSGFKYPLYNAEITDWFPLGVSNEIIEEKGEAKVKDGELLIIQTN